MNTPPPFNFSPFWSSRTKRTILVFVFIFAVLALWWFSDILPLVIVSIVLAYLLTPVVNFFDQRVLVVGPLGKYSHRGLAVFFTYVFVVMLFVVIILVVLPAFVQQLEDLGSRLPQTLDSAGTEIERVLSEPLTFNGQPILIDGKPLIPLQRLTEITGAHSLTELLQLENVDLVGAAQTFIGSVGGLTAPAFSFVGGAVNTLINLGFLLVMMFYLMKDGSLFVNKAVSLTPEIYRGDLRRLLWELAQVWNAYLRGQIVLGLVMGSLVFTVATLLGVPNAPILGLLSGLLEFIPSLGPLLGMLLAALLALLSTSATLPFLSGLPFAIVVIVAWSGLQNIEAFVIVPRIMGGRLDLHPFVIILGVIGGASVAGALGVILAAPFVASARVLAQYFYGKLTDQDPFPIRDRRHKPITPGWVLRLFTPPVRWVAGRLRTLSAARDTAVE